MQNQPPPPPIQQPQVQQPPAIQQQPMQQNYQRYGRQRKPNSQFWILFGVIGGIGLLGIITLVIILTSGGSDSKFGSAGNRSPILVSNPKFFKVPGGLAKLRVNYKIKRRDELPDTLILVCDNLESKNRKFRFAKTFKTDELKDDGIREIPFLGFLDGPVAKQPLPLNGDLRFTRRDGNTISNVISVPLPAGTDHLPRDQ